MTQDAVPEGTTGDAEAPLGLPGPAAPAPSAEGMTVDAEAPLGLPEPAAPAPSAEETPRTGWRERVAAWWGLEPARTPRQRARRRAITRGAVAGGLLLVVGSVVQLPLLVMSPGPTYNTIGEVDGEPMIVITGTRTYPTEGNLDMTTISERGGTSGGVHLGEALVGWAARRSTVVPRDTVYGPEVTGEEASQRNDSLFALSLSDSVAAAMNELGIDTQTSVVVTVVGAGTPADGIVQAGDVVVAVDGTPVTTPADVGEAVRARGIGETVVLDVLRAEQPDADRVPRRLEVVTAANPDPPPSADQPAPYLGIVVGTQYEAPFDIDFTLDQVGGPSAGMMFSLALVDMLTPAPMTGGGHVAGTGTIDPVGTVGPIGGLPQKLLGAREAGATLFLAPRDNCDEVLGNEPDGLTIVPVSTLAEARDTVERWAADPQADLPSCASVAASAG